MNWVNRIQKFETRTIAIWWQNPETEAKKLDSGNRTENLAQRSEHINLEQWTQFLTKSTELKNKLRTFKLSCKKNLTFQETNGRRVTTHSSRNLTPENRFKCIYENFTAPAHQTHAWCVQATCPRGRWSTWPRPTLPSTTWVWTRARSWPPSTLPGPRTSGL